MLKTKLIRRVKMTKAAMSLASFLRWTAVLKNEAVVFALNIPEA